MRSIYSLLAAGLMLASAGGALAQTGGSMGAEPGRAGSTTTSPSSGAPSSGSADSAASAGANTSATAGGFQVGEPVKDNTGATIGSIAALSPGANGSTMAVIKMGTDSFQVATDRLGSANGAATINLTQAQISTMLHSKSGASGGSSSPP